MLLNMALPGLGLSGEDERCSERLGELELLVDGKRPQEVERLSDVPADSVRDRLVSLGGDGRLSERDLLHSFFSYVTLSILSKSSVLVSSLLLPFASVPAK